MDKWTEIRLEITSGRMSIREAARKYGLNWRTIRKTLDHVEPPGYQKNAERPKRAIGPFLPIIHEILEADKKVHKNSVTRGSGFLLGCVMNMGTLAG